MNLNEFKAGIYKQQYNYKSFSPSSINHDWTWSDPVINVLLEEATRALGELNAYTLIVPDVDMFIRMNVMKEAVTSSRIEGTRTEMDEAFMGINNIQPERKDDWQEVQNYVEAMNSAISELEKLPLSNRILRNSHRILMSGVRGEHKNPGEFRRSQNWIGGTSLQDAFFIPPSHEEVPEFMSDLEKFWHNQSIQVPHLIRIAISHYQFETIHPFLDGNGRIGRLLITLYLVSNGLLKKPSLYLSSYIEKNKDAYYDALTVVRGSNDLGQWVRFFLKAVLETANSAKLTFDKVLKLKNEIDEKLLSFGRRAENAGRLINALYRQPSLSIHDVIQITGLKKWAANELLKEFVNQDILQETTGYSRNRIYMFTKYLEIFLASQ